ncbi:LuxR C-terminal-related transcriptional regulator [Serratia sp. DD3]|uniref:helix-turn-helix transcriptional regulator n=1 Tax=Serratia sp. DD3 TaxID=1410619 RepID=UPI000567419F|nr:LuxR C-terminal-related transcriptional regulator [Serratia sp. DD3]
MPIYVTTQNNYFFMGLSSAMMAIGHSIKRETPRNLVDKIKKNKYKNSDIFILNMSNFCMKISYLISVGEFPGQIIIIPTKDKNNFNHAFMQHTILDRKATIEEIDSAIKKVTASKKLFKKNILSEREKSVFSYIIDGKSISFISLRLNISPKTTYAHKNSVIRKLGGRTFFDIWPIEKGCIKLILDDSTIADVH